MKDIFLMLMEYGNSKLELCYAKRILKDGVGKTPMEIVSETKGYELMEKMVNYLSERIKWILKCRRKK